MNRRPRRGRNACAGLVHGLVVRSAARAAAALLLVSPLARAQSAPQLQLQADSPVGVGSIVHLQLNATSAEAMPTDPHPGPTPGFVVRGQSSAPSQTHIIANGSRMDRYTLSVTWTLEAQRVGTFRVGPATVVAGGARYATQPITVRVVPAGQAPRRPPSQSLPQGFPQGPFGPSPFDLWKGLLQGGFDNDVPSAPSAPELSIDPSLSIEPPRGASFFLHATVDKSAAVVGEQVTFSVYQYSDTSARVDFDPEDMHDPTAADFAKRQMLREDQPPPLAGYAASGGRTWEVKLVRRWALFPLRAGELTIGPMRLNLVRAGSGPSERTSETLQVRVTEPPAARRPPGYALGDVGRFSLSAQVSPREIDEGSAVGVHVELSGTGNVPGTLTPPVREGVEWLAPEVREELGPTGHDAFGGKRTFDYVVRVLRAGRVDLGEFALPYWDPEQRRYEVARAPLGAVQVRSSAAVKGGPAAPAEQTLPGLPARRDALDASITPRAHADDSPWFWLGAVAGWPAAFGVAVAGRAAGRRAATAWRTRRQSAAAELKEKLAAAH
ncbi:MAG TPA: BatD family protein, partial [Polyangiaceae bacterium]|nr:BatD family protein [Polyangiaceae bacterium]